MEDVLQAIEVARATGKIRKGVNEVTKAVERGKATLVAIANDVSPKELIMHIRPLCEEKGVQCVEDVASKEELGAAAGIARPTVAVAITQAGDAKNIIKDVKADTSSDKTEDSKEEKAEE
jgi:large subunit ribosomal protein L7Ae